MGRPQFYRTRQRKTGRFTGAQPVPRCAKTGKYLKMPANAEYAKPKREAKSRTAVSAK